MTHSYQNIAFKFCVQVKFTPPNGFITVKVGCEVQNAVNATNIMGRVSKDSFSGLIKSDRDCGCLFVHL